MANARCWCFTINNPTEEERTLPQCWDAKYAVWQYEKGENDTPHIQGYVSFVSPARLSAMKKLSPTAHWEQAKGTAQQNREYCTKEKGRLAGPWEKGVLPLPGKRNDLDAVKDALLTDMPMSEILTEHFSVSCKHYRFWTHFRAVTTPERTWEMDVLVIVGPTGVGKSRQAVEEAPGAYRKPPASLWWDGYDRHANVIIDDYAGGMPYHYMLNLLDRYGMLVETKGGHVQFVAKKIVITSNRHPRDWYSIDYPYAPLERRLSRIQVIHDQPVLVPVPVPRYRNGLPVTL